MDANPGDAVPVDAVPPYALVLGGRITRADLPALRAELEALLHARAAGAPRDAPGAIDCDLAGVTRPGLALVDVLARLALTARRAGTGLRLHNPPPGLDALLDLAGLAEVIGGAGERGRGVREPGPAE
ncbi:STAS domain-containing protein [uncultured Streptomyces sp.]|uniref:STAS domain-containing protein n=1 Tax=uncultured Streptomyces sp. TaxID=174707 RepID=UPI003430C6FB